MITWLLIKIKGKEFILFLYAFIILNIICFTFFGFKFIIFDFCLFIFLKIFESIKIKRNNIFDVYFGVPGSGKSTVATSLFMDEFSKKLNRTRRKVFTRNIDLKGAIPLNKNDLDVSNTNIYNSLILMDEVSSDFHARNFAKNFSEENIRCFKTLRHMNIDLVIFSQGFDDMDKVLRTLSTRYFILKKSIIPFFIKRQLILKKIDIDKETHQIIDCYYKVPFSSFYFFMPRTWKHFNSHQIIS